MARKTAEPPAPVGVVQAIDGFAGPHGVFVRGARVRADHPAVLFAPQLWAPDGALESEISEQRNRVFYDESDRRVHEAELERRRQLRQQNYRVALRDFTVDCEPIDGLPDWGQVTVRAGEHLPAADPIVKAHPQHFGKID